MRFIKYFLIGFFVFFLSTLNAQHFGSGFSSNGLSLFFSSQGFPFSNLLVEDTLPDRKNESIVLDYISSNEKELNKVPISKTSKWQFTSLRCSSQQGMMNQNQAFFSEANYLSNDSITSFTCSELINEFSKDTLFKVNLSPDDLFGSERPQDGVWNFVQVGDILFVKMSRNLANSSSNGNNLIPNQFYHWEEYWYFFRQL